MNNHLSCSLGEGLAIIHINNGNRFGLDPIGEKIWNLMQNPIAVSAIVDTLVSEYEVLHNECERDTIGLLNKLYNAGLISAENNEHMGLEI